MSSKVEKIYENVGSRGKYINHVYDINKGNERNTRKWRGCAARVSFVFSGREVTFVTLGRVAAKQRA